MKNLYETNRILFWLFGCMIAGSVWGIIQSSLWSAVVYAGVLFAFGVIYELFFNKNRSK